jgi:hypothetical protein
MRQFEDWEAIDDERFDLKMRGFEDAKKQQEC